MMTRLLLSILFIFSHIGLFAQKATLKGFIQDNAGTPLSGISVQLEGTRHQAITDDQGNFTLLHVTPGSFTLTATGIGYTAKKQDVSLSAGQLLTLGLQLNTDRKTLSEVEVRQLKPQQSSTLTRTNTPLKDIPQQIQSVNRSLMNDQQLFQLDEAFKYVAGFTASNYYGGFSSRGYGANVSEVTTNGIKGTVYSEGQIPLLGNIESVEVIHGPSAILYGQGGLGGSINLVGKQPKKYTAVNASVTAGSFDLYRVQADVTGSINKKKTLYFLAGAGWQNGGSFTRDMERRSTQVYGAVKWELSDKTSWQVNANYVNDDAGNNYQPRVPIYNSRDKDSLFLVPYDFNPGKDSRYQGHNYQVQSVMEHRFYGQWKIGLLAAYTTSRAERRQYTASGFVRTTDNTVSRSYSWQQINSPQTTVNLYTSGELRTWKVKHTVTAGGDVMLARNNYPNGILQYAASRLAVDGSNDESHYDTTGMTQYLDSRLEKFTYNTLGAYVQDQVEITPELKVLAGLRYNNYFRRYYAENRDGTVLANEKPLRTENFSPRLGLVYQPVKSLSVYLDYNEGFSPIYSNNAVNGGPFDPETSKQYELGAKGEFLGGRFLPFVAIYQSTKKNVLQSDPQPDFPYWMTAIGEVRSRGIETGFKGTLFSNLFVIVNYNYNKTKITKSKKPDEINQLFANSPQNTANAYLKYTFTKTALKGLFAGSGVQYVASRYFANRKENNPNVLQMPSYTVFDAMIGYHYKQYRLQVNANNLANKRYAASGVSNSYTPGTPRNIMVTFSCSFR